MYHIDYMKSMGEKIGYERGLKIEYYKKNGRTSYRPMRQIDLARKIDEFLKPEETKNDPQWDHKGRRVQVSAWEHGKGKLTLDAAIAICDILGLDINYLLGVTKEKLPLELVIKEREQEAGLTEESSNILREKPGIAEAINYLLKSDDGIQMIETLYRLHNANKEE